MSNSNSRQEAGERAFLAGKEIAELVRSKNSAYGDAAALQLGLWTALLQQYKVGDEYHIPVALFDHVPRLTRVFDRIARIVANPVTDQLKEDPWRDLAGDAIVGIIMPRTPLPRPCIETGCELPDGHEGSHVSVHSGLRRVWPIRMGPERREDQTLFMEGHPADVEQNADPAEVKETVRALLDLAHSLVSRGQGSAKWHEDAKRWFELLRSKPGVAVWAGAYKRFDPAPSPGEEERSETALQPTTAPSRIPGDDEPDDSAFGPGHIMPEKRSRDLARALPDPSL